MHHPGCRLAKHILVILSISASQGAGQVHVFPYLQDFDSIIPPALPPEWTSSQNRSPGTNDFTTSSSSPHSSPHALLCTNAMVEQTATSPILDFTGFSPGVMTFYTRRSSTFGAKLVVEASLDGGRTFTLLVGDTIRFTGATAYVPSSCVLPPPLEGVGQVRVRWRIIPDESGATGTLRIDDITISVTTSFDLSITAFAASPSVAREGDEIVARGVVHNLGSRSAEGFSFLIYRDTDNDSIARPPELIHSTSSMLPLQPHDSISFVAPLGQLQPGIGPLIGVVECGPDEIRGNNLLFAPLNVGWRAGSIVVNEIMYTPAGSEPEWIELFNLREDSICVRTWSVSDAATSSRHSFAEVPLAVPPSGFIVLTRDSVELRHVYPIVTAPVIEVAGFPSLNNGGDAIVLFDDVGRLMDSLVYRPSWGGTAGGKSLERVDPALPSLDSSNWRTSTDSLGATPGNPNSIVALDYDLFPVSGTKVTYDATSVLVRVTIGNCGKLTPGPFRLMMYNDVNRDSTPGQDELVLQSADVQSPPRHDSVAVELRWDHPGPGMHSILAVVELAGDMRLANNSIMFTICVPVRVGTMMINEIMYSPLSGNAEYLEVVNTGNAAIGTYHWKIEVGAPGSMAPVTIDLSRVPVSLGAGEFLVIASDTAIFRQFGYLRDSDGRRRVAIGSTSLGLNNDGDYIAVREPGGSIVDSVAYSPSWHSSTVVDVRGRALEKIKPTGGSNDRRNWGTCVMASGGTPGKSNSIHTESLPAGSRLGCTPNPFSPDGDGRDDYTIVHFELPLQASVISIKIFDVRGRMIRRLSNLEPAGPTGDVVWDGREDDGRKARIGIYIIFLEAMDDQQGVLVEAKSIVVLGAKL